MASFRKNDLFRNACGILLPMFLIMVLAPAFSAPERQAELPHAVQEAFAAYDGDTTATVRGVYRLDRGQAAPRRACKESISFIIEDGQLLFSNRPTIKISDKAVYGNELFRFSIHHFLASRMPDAPDFIAFAQPLAAYNPRAP